MFAFLGRDATGPLWNGDWVLLGVEEKPCRHSRNPNQGKRGEPVPIPLTPKTLCAKQLDEPKSPNDTDIYQAASKYRKQTVLNMTDTEMDHLAYFLGHDLRVQIEFNKLMKKTTQLAKISRFWRHSNKHH